MTDDLSRGEQRIAQLKAAPRGPFHFGLFGLMCVTAAVAFLVALPRWIDLPYTGYFALWYGVLYACAPLVGWTVVAACPQAIRHWRKVLAFVVTAGLVMPVLIIAVPDDSFFVILSISVFVLWLPQVLCIAALQYFVFK